MPQFNANGTMQKTRKSTLTQSQRNMKRQRATPEQFEVLTREFSINATPDARKREEIGAQIEMTERSVQIWFQNKRAKAKQAQNREMKAMRERPLSPTNSSMFATPASSQMTTPLSFDIGNAGYMPFEAPQQIPPPPPPPPPPPLPLPPPIPFPSPHAAQNLVPEGSTLIPATSLRIGYWTRVTSPRALTDELTIFFNYSNNLLSYIMFRDDGQGFRIDVSFLAIERVELAHNEENFSEGIIKVTVPDSNCLTFSVQSAIGDNEWMSSDDFSEQCQASQVTLHQLFGGYPQMHYTMLKLHELHPSKVVLPVEDRPQVPERSLTQSTPASLFSPPMDRAALDSVSESNLISPASQTSSHKHTISSSTDNSDWLTIDTLDTFDTLETLVSSPGSQFSAFTFEPKPTEQGELDDPLNYTLDACYEEDTANLLLSQMEMDPRYFNENFVLDENESVFS